jgi:hypothetical protein
MGHEQPSRSRVAMAALRQRPDVAGKRRGGESGQNRPPALQTKIGDAFAQHTGIGMVGCELAGRHATTMVR